MRKPDSRETRTRRISLIRGKEERCLKNRAKHSLCGERQTKIPDWGGEKFIPPMKKEQSLGSPHLKGEGRSGKEGKHHYWCGKNHFPIHAEKKKRWGGIGLERRMKSCHIGKAFETLSKNLSRGRD